MIREALSGKNILLTGVTGFLGTALFERLLLDTSVERIDLVIRGDGPARLDALLTTSAFSTAVDDMGIDALRELVARRTRVVTADLSYEDPEVADDIDLVIHPAATISFDPPIDEAFNTNLHGTLRLLSSSRRCPFVHISTAYVAGLAKGFQPEEIMRRDVDWRAEADAAARLRSETEIRSRDPRLLQELEAKARAEMGRVGPAAVGRRCEELRLEWLSKTLVDSGRARARSLGWPDVYSFTKALTEIALDESANGRPVTIVRPSIIESALARPYPGWIEGFKMTDPVFIAFGRGALPEFPGIPEGVVDIIPVDLVVNATLAAAATTLREQPRTRIYHVSTGSRNPLTMREVYELGKSYFIGDPLPEPGRGTFKAPDWSFPGRRAVERKLRSTERFIGYAERVVDRLPRNKFSRDQLRKVYRLRSKFDMAKRLADLYGPYVEAEIIFRDDNTAALFDSLSDEDRRDFSFDPTSFDWRTYFHELHIPQITEPVRSLTTNSRTTPKVDLESRSPNGPVLAVFDVEGTVVQSNVLEPYLWLRMAEIEGAARFKQVTALASRVPKLVKAERRDRGEFLRGFYRLYEGASVEDIETLAAQVLPDLVLRRLSPAAVRRIRAHRAAGHRIVFITGSLPFVVAPIAPLADQIVAASLRQRDGRFTGDLDRPPLVGEARSSWLTEHARDNDIDLSHSYGYGDSVTDLPLLESVGNPVAVNPDVALTRVARKRRWPIEEWESDRGTPKILMPEPVR